MAALAIALNALPDTDRAALLFYLGIGGTQHTLSEVVDEFAGSGSSLYRTRGLASARLQSSIDVLGQAHPGVIASLRRLQ
jgi:hypothetical protein